MKVGKSIFTKAQSQNNIEHHNQMVRVQFKFAESALARISFNIRDASRKVMVNAASSSWGIGANIVIHSFPAKLCIDTRGAAILNCFLLV